MATEEAVSICVCVGSEVKDPESKGCGAEDQTGSQEKKSIYQICKKSYERRTEAKIPESFSQSPERIYDMKTQEAEWETSWSSDGNAKPKTMFDLSWQGNFEPRLVIS